MTPGAFTELDWTRIDVWAIVACSGIATIEERQGLKIACLEEIGMRAGWLSAQAVAARGNAMSSEYGRYLEAVAHEYKLATRGDAPSTVPHEAFHKAA